jgi:hypothetical protein
MNWFFAGFALVLLLWVFALLYLKSYVRRRTSPDHILSMLQEEVRQLEADIDEKTEQDLQLLEEKIRTLRELCTETERRIAVYQRELGRREREEQTFALLDRSPPSVPPAGNDAGASAPAAARRAGGAGEASPRGKTKKSRRHPPDRGGTGAKAPRNGQKPLPEPRRSASLLEGLEVRDAAAAYRAQIRPQSPAGPAGRAAVSIPLPPARPAAGEGGIETTDERTAPKIIISPQPVSSRPLPLKERIAELYRAGFSPELIAERLEISVEETGLYIAMVKGS